MVIGVGPVRVPYHLPELLQRSDEWVILNEGEKAADRAMQEGLLATCVEGQHWTDNQADYFANRDVLWVQEGDTAGTKNTANALERLVQVGTRVRVWRPGGGRHDDLFNWLEAGHTKEELLAIAATLPVHGQINAKPYVFPDERALPLWDWLYGKHLSRGAVSATVAPGGTGKSTLSIAEALAMAADRTLLRGQVPRPLRVCFINVEDGRAAMDKRIVAAKRHYNITDEEIGDRLIVIAKGEFKLKIAGYVANGKTVQRNELLIQHLIDFITKNQIDVLSIDPLVRTHGVSENFNEEMTAVLECYDDIAIAANCAVHIWHHTRKLGGNEVTIDAARGAGAFVDVCRSVRMLETMSKEEAKKLKVEGGYVSEFNGKHNFAPRSDERSWYKFVSITLDNAGALFGDEVGVVTPWMHPGQTQISLTPGTIMQIKAKVAAGRWREHPQSDAWVGKGIAEVLQIDPARHRQVLKALINNLITSGVLKREQGQDAHREAKMFVVSGTADAVAPKNATVTL
jgi:hypothetical protein